MTLIFEPLIDKNKFALGFPMTNKAVNISVTENQHSKILLHIARATAIIAAGIFDILRNLVCFLPRMGVLGINCFFGPVRLEARPSSTAEPKSEKPAILAITAPEPILLITAPPIAKETVTDKVGTPVVEEDQESIASSLSEREIVVTHKPRGLIGHLTRGFVPNCSISDALTSGATSIIEAMSKVASYTGPNRAFAAILIGSSVGSVLAAGIRYVVTREDIAHHTVLHALKASLACWLPYELVLLRNYLRARSILALRSTSL